MNLIIFGAVLIFFPLNSLLIFSDSWKSSSGEKIFLSNLPESNDTITIENQGLVEGVEKENHNFSAPLVSGLPIRKAESSDLAVPNAHSSLILDVESGTILHNDGGKEKRSIASLTKIMTAILVVEKIDDLEKEIVVVGQKAVYAEGTKIGCPRSGYCLGNRLLVGEKISAYNLLKAMLINSANDAAIALAEHIAGSEDEFVKIMNKKAESLGLKDTRFCTSSGLDIDGKENECYSTAYDIARIASYSTKYDSIWDNFRVSSEVEIFSADGKRGHKLINTVANGETIPNCLGAKTGFTPAAGHSLLLVATDPTKKHKIVAVVLDNPYRWQDIRRMVDWAFSAHQWR